MKQLQRHLKFYFSHPIALILSGAVCCGLALFYHIRSQNKLDFLEQTAMQLKKKQQWTEQKNNLETKLLHQLKVADRDYIEKELESLKFLGSEIKKLQALIYSDPQNELLNDRLHFLESDQNRLRFKEQNFQRLEGFQELEVIQDHPVEMNGDDLKALISRIENKPIGALEPTSNPPDLLIKKFELVKKPMSSNEETFLINLELIKYEMIHE